MLRTSVRLTARKLALDQAGDVEPRRVQWLQDVVACGRQEAGLVEVGFVSLALGDGEGLIDLASARRCAPARAVPASRWRAPAPRTRATRSVMSE